MTKVYRTLVKGRLRQLTGLCVGGSANDPGGADMQCARDGQGRLTIPGSGIAGALIETAGRIFPKLFKDGDDGDKDLSRITMKGKPTRKDTEDSGLRQSLWQFSPSHLAEATPEFRQGVGIRHATGATASEAKALFDAETIPAGHEWDFFFEVDSLRGGVQVEAVSLYALWEWSQGRCWLGANAARGLGNMQLVDFEVLRLPATRDIIDRWPDVTKDRDALFDELKAAHPEAVLPADRLRATAESLWKDLPPNRFWYAVITATFAAGQDKDGYGWDTLSVGGHASGLLEPASDELVAPRGIEAKAFRESYSPDAPVVTTQRRGDRKKPFVPGSGVRGPLRHATTRWHNTDTAKVIDPNTAEARQAKDNDPVSLLFGLAQRGGRLLVGDAGLVNHDFKLVCLQHHAEDEFTAGVYGSGKFDRTAVLKGEFRVKLVIEAPKKDELEAYLKTLLPALTLAEAGFVPLGGGKWRGHGWLKWEFQSVKVGQAGSELKAAEGDRVAVKVKAALAAIGGAS